MITSFNPENKVQFEMYTKLFSEAYYDLYKTEGTFDSLDQYFAHMAELVAIEPKYLMIPLDEASEGIFSINANERTVTIPTQFSKCGAVQGDEICEIAVFTIDRYFDFQDLDMVKICIQWINANGDEGISHIQIKDVKTFPGKLRFGWPLTSKITAKDGPIQFAVRFYKEDEDKKMTYILNTLPATLTVKKGLSLSEDAVVEENVLDLFKDVVANSQNPSYEIPKNPFFIAPGHDLIASNYSKTGFGAIDADNKLSITAQAVANDLGTISYAWKYKDVNGEIIPLKVLKTEVDKDEDFDTDNYYTEDLYYIRKGYTIEDPFLVPIQQPTEEDKVFTREGCQKYWVEGESGELERFDGNEFDKNTTYYVKETKLEILPDTKEFPIEIVGSYFVEAVNTALFNGEPVNNSQSISSKTLLVPAPAEVIIDKDLSDHVFIDKEKGVKLSIDLKADPNGPAIGYQWYSTAEKPASIDDLDAITGETNKELNVSEAGWYSILATSTLNRTVKTNDDDENNRRKYCKATFLPEAPEVSKIWYCALSSDASEAEIAEIIADTQNTLGKWTEVDKDADEDTNVEIDRLFGSIVLMKYDTNLDAESELKTEDLTYQWYVQNDKGVRPLDETDIGPNGLIYSKYDEKSKILVARCIENNISYTYHCEITNHIQDKTAKLDTSNVYTFTIV